MSTSTYLAKLSYGLIKVSGVDAIKLLQGQLTCDVEKIDLLHACLGAQCNPQGRILSLFYLFFVTDAYYLMLPRNMVNITMTALKKYAVFYKVDIRDVSDEFICLGYSDDATHALILTANLPIFTFPQLSSRHLTFGHSDVINSLFQPHRSNEVTDKDWKQHDIDEGIPSIYPETSAMFLPHELNLQQLNGISFDKGCYTGQEIVARMHYLGKLKKQMRKIIINSDIAPQPGSDMDGQVVDILQNAHHEYIALVVTDKLSEPK